MLSLRGCLNSAEPTFAFVFVFFFIGPVIDKTLLLPPQSGSRRSRLWWSSPSSSAACLSSSSSASSSLCRKADASSSPGPSRFLPVSSSPLPHRPHNWAQTRQNTVKKNSHTFDFKVMASNWLFGFQPERERQHNLAKWFIFSALLQFAELVNVCLRIHHSYKSTLTGKLIADAHKAGSVTQN